MHRRAGALAILAALCAATSAQAASAPDRGTAWEPTPVSQPLYGTKAPSEDPAAQQHTVIAKDGVKLFIETWLPKASGASVPPAKVPTILIMTPYVTEGVQRYTDRSLANVISYFTARGFAVAQGDVRGTGESGGCLEQTSVNQIDDGARFVEYLGRDAPWSNGSVGMYGISYDGETQVSVAGLGDPEKTKYLKAIVPSESVGGQYEWSNYDGVPFTGAAMLGNGGYFASSMTDYTGDRVTPDQRAEKVTCQPETLAMSADPSGGMNPFWKLREYRPGAKNIKAATLWLHGFADYNVLPLTIAGFFDNLPATTPKAGLFGWWEHNFPDKHAGVSPEWARKDWLPMATAWYDRWLKGLDSGADRWPKVQVQDSTGQWRAENEFPTTGGPIGQLALGSGTLGDPQPTGTSAFTGGNGSAVFTTPAFSAPLHITGQPVADLLVSSTSPAAPVTAVLEVLGPDGKTITLTGDDKFNVRTTGTRSLAFADAMPLGWFEQATPNPKAPNSVIRLPVRLLPTDIVVPAGGKLRLTIAGDGSAPKDVMPYSTGAQITIIHNCSQQSVLRFLTASPDAPLLNVRETDQASALASSPETAGVADGGGLASAPVCGKAPVDPLHVIKTNSG
jgi:predicted acyl esterase